MLPSICTTTARGELHAALELIDFLLTVVREHKMQFNRIVYWTDSQTVLGYLKNQNKHLHVFESNRVKKILESSLLDQWKWVDTSQNPTNIFSQGVSPSRPSAAES